jgi:hypothetical protein
VGESLSLRHPSLLIQTSRHRRLGWHAILPSTRRRPATEPSADGALPLMQ